MNKKPLSQFFASVQSFFSLLFGKFAWNSPPWFSSVRRKIMEYPKVFLGFFFFIIIVIGTFYWYKKLPHTPLITAKITAPQITPIAKTLVPDVLTIDFGIQTNTFTAKSVAPLNQISKEVTEGITLNPQVPGKWLWQNDNRLVFTPGQDWPAGQSYTVSFDKKVFAPGTKLESHSYSFSTQPFQANIAEFKFYQDPLNAKLRKAVATIQFNYPVDTTSFENNITLTLEALKNNKLNLNAQHFKFTVNYDENKRIAYLNSEPLQLPEASRYLVLTLNKGIKSLSGSDKTNATVSQNVLIPDASSYFKVTTTSADIVYNDQDRPEQVLTLETSLGVTEAELNKSLHVYLLPQDYPATATEDIKTNYEWQNPGEVTEDILKSSTPVNLKTIPADRDYATLHSYQFLANTPRYIYLKLDKGVRGFGDFVLSNDYAAIIKVPEYPKEIGFLHKGALLALSSEKKLSVVVRGVPAVKFEIARVLPDDVNQLITQTSGDFNDPKFINPSFNQQNISEIFSTIQTFDAENLAKPQYTALDLGKYLSTKTNSGPQGLFLLKATGWNVKDQIPLQNDAYENIESNRLILITNLGLVVKDNNDGTHDVFVESITQGIPLAHVTVSILGKNGLPILTRTTDEQGRVTFPTMKDFIEDREPVVYLAKLGDDVSFIPYNNAERQLNYSRYEIGGVYNNPEAQSLSAYLFSDRGIYRPGDIAHVGMIVKQTYAQSQPPGLPLEATVTDPRGTTILDKKFTLDATGYLSLDFQTEAHSPTGQYSINLYIVRDNHASNLLGSYTVRVEEFQPDTMRITSHLSHEQAKGWISPEGLTVNVGLWNLYGAPATNRKITGKIILTPQQVKFDEYPQYIFIDPSLDPNKPPKTFIDTLPDTTSDDKGQAKFDLNLERFDKATYQLTFITEGFEAGAGRSVITQTNALISTLPYFVGYKADRDLNYIKQNAERSVNFIAVNPQLIQQEVNNLKIQLISLHPVTTLVKKDDGTYQYQSLIQTKIIDTKPFSITSTGTAYTLPTQQIGDFAISVLDQNNVELSRFKFSVVGASQLPLAKNAELSVKINKPIYNSDENIELQITAPYTGSGLITIERDKVYATQWFKTDTTNSVQKIHIPKDFKGNGYVNVAFVRDWNSPEIFISPLSYSVVPFTVNHEEHAVNIELDTPALARPGEPFHIQYKTDKPSKIIVFAVDEGILQVTHYKTPDPLAYFFQKRALEVLTQQTLDQILPKFVKDRELSAVGGDGGEEEIGKHLNPFKRKTDLPVVYWSGIIDADSTSRELIYQVPDYFNGTLSVMAVAVANDAVGSAEKKSEIRGDFVINPNTPTTVAPNDEFEITASVANNVKNSGDNAKVTVELQSTPQLEILGSANQTLTVPEGHEQVVKYKLRAKSLLGSAQLTFTASMGDKSSKINSTISVRPASAFMTSVASGSSHDVHKTLTLDRVMYPEYRTREAMSSTSPLILVGGLQRYLDNYPYGCTEQLTSKAFPLLALESQTWLINNSREISDKVQLTIQMLGQRQMSSGGFSYWPGIGENESNTFASVYAMHFLTEAKAHGYTVPNEVFRSGLAYLKELSSQNVEDMDKARTQAYAIYVLTRNEIVTTNFLTNLQLYLDQHQADTWKHDIISAYIASTYLLLKNYPDANGLIEGFKSKSSDDNSSIFYSNKVADAVYLYLVAKHFPDLLPRLGDKLVMPLVAAMNNDEMNTIFSGYASLALNAYAQSYQATHKASLSINETLENGKLKTNDAMSDSYQKINIDDLAKQITFNNPDKQLYYYQLTQAGFDKKPSTNIIKQGLEVYREFRDTQGNVITKTTLGNEIEVHIQIRALDNRYLDHIAIVDLLPGGFEVVSSSIHSDNIEYVDIREDRVVFFTSIDSNAKEIIYRIKATNIGLYTVPSIFAESMYTPNIQASGVPGTMTVVSS